MSKISIDIMQGLTQYLGRVDFKKWLLFVLDIGFVMIHNTPQLTMMGAAGAAAGSIQVNPIFQQPGLFSDVNITGMYSD